MFAVNKKYLTDAVHRMQRTFCSYDMYEESSPKKDDEHIPSFCDCKYGFSGRSHVSEQTGCPELRLIHSLLNVMTDKEYEELIVRAGGIL